MKYLLLFLPLFSFAQQQLPIDSTRYGLAKPPAIQSRPIVVSKFGAPEKGFSNGSATGTMYQYRFSPAVSCVGAQFSFPNWTLGNTAGGAAGEAIGANPITVVAYVYGAGYLTFNGQQSVTIIPGGTVKSDPCPYNLTRGTNYFIRVYVSVSTLGMTWPLGLDTQTSLNEGTVSGTDPSTGTVTTAIAPGYGPLCVTGIPVSQRNLASVWIFGDSTFDGNSGGGTGVNLDQGWIWRGLIAAGVPCARMTVGGDRMLNHTGTLALALTNITGGDIVIVGYGANDIPGFADLPTALAAYHNFWTEIAATGARVRQCTIPPRISFTAAQETIRQGINADIRTTALLDKFIELADQVETSRNSGVWKTNYSTDNVHIASTQEAAVGAALIIITDFKK